MEPNYDFDEILAMANHPTTGKEYYLIKWTDYSIAESTWEPASNINDPGEAVEQFLSTPQMKNMVFNIPPPWEVDQ